MPQTNYLGERVGFDKTFTNNIQQRALKFCEIFKTVCVNRQTKKKFNHNKELQVYEHQHQYIWCNIYKIC